MFIGKSQLPLDIHGYIEGLGGMMATTGTAWEDGYVLAAGLPRSGL